MFHTAAFLLSWQQKCLHPCLLSHPKKKQKTKNIFFIPLCFALLSVSAVHFTKLTVPSLAVNTLVHTASENYAESTDETFSEPEPLTLCSADADVTVFFSPKRWAVQLSAI